MTGVSLTTRKKGWSSKPCFRGNSEAKNCQNAPILNGGYTALMYDSPSSQLGTVSVSKTAAVVASSQTRVSFNGRTLASQANNVGSIPITRSRFAFIKQRLIAIFVFWGSSWGVLSDEGLQLRLLDIPLIVVQPLGIDAPKHLHRMPHLLGRIGRRGTCHEQHRRIGVAHMVGQPVTNAQGLEHRHPERVVKPLLVSPGLSMRRFHKDRL